MAGRRTRAAGPTGRSAAARPRTDSTRSRRRPPARPGQADGYHGPAPSPWSAAQRRRSMPAGRSLIFLLACSGAAALLTRGWVLARGTRPPALAALAAGVCYAWNPFVAERLLIGQWALLLGYAGLPWVVRSLCTGQ